MPRPIRFPTGASVYPLPDIDVDRLAILWAGPGSRLLIGQPLTAGGAVTSIDHPTASGAYATRTEADAAVRAFIAAGTDD